MTTKEIRIPTDNKTDCSLQVHIATHAWERREIYRLRYEVYVQEMAKPLGATINNDNQLYDSLDNRSILLYAQAGSDIVATMRITIAAAEDYPADLTKVFHLHKFKALYTDCSNPLFSLGTKLAVTAKYRNSPALFLLIAETYRILRKQMVQFFFGGCNPYMIPLYERMGFRRFTQNFTDPGYGLLVPLVAIPEDIQHFQAVRSPLYRHVRKYVNDFTMARRFLQAFPEASECLNTQLVTRESLWEYLERKLDISPLTIPVFKHLDVESVMDLLRAGVIFPCAPGDCIVHQGSICNDLYILLSGTLVAAAKTSSRILRPGEYFGGFTLPDQYRQTESVSALTESELFVVPRQAFARYQHLHQQASAILLSNLNSAQSFAHDCPATMQGGQKHE